jgi:hypothetical protein
LLYIIIFPEEIPLINTSPYKTREVYKKKPLVLIYIISSRFTYIVARKEDFIITSLEPEIVPKLRNSLKRLLKSNRNLIK